MSFALIAYASARMRCWHPDASHRLRFSMRSRWDYAPAPDSQSPAGVGATGRRRRYPGRPQRSAVGPVADSRLGKEKTGHGGHTGLGVSNHCGVNVWAAAILLMFLILYYISFVSQTRRADKSGDGLAQPTFEMTPVHADLQRHFQPIARKTAAYGDRDLLPRSRLWLPTHARRMRAYRKTTGSRTVG